MAAEIIEPTEGEKLAAAAVGAIFGLTDILHPHRIEVAQKMLTTGVAYIALVEGPQAMADLLRGIADHLENLPASGTA